MATIFCNFSGHPLYMYMIRSFISSGAEVQNIPNIGPKRDEGDVKF